MNTVIKVGTITNAQRSIRLLRNAGFKAQINRITNPSKEDGCGYVVVIDENADLDKAVNILKKNGINIRGVEQGDIS